MDPMMNGQPMGMHGQHNGPGSMQMMNGPPPGMMNGQPPMNMQMQMGPGMNGMHMGMMPGGPGDMNMMPNMSQMPNPRKTQAEATNGGGKKRKKNSPRAQATAVQAVNAGMMGPGMEHGGMMMGRDNPIVAQNPFDDFGGPMDMHNQHMGARMPGHFMPRGPPPRMPHQGGQMPMYPQNQMMNYGEPNGNMYPPQMRPMHAPPGGPQMMNPRMMNPGDMPQMRHHFPEGNIIKNQQNPNAPPTYICGTCGVECQENDQAIICESGCRTYYHRTCVGLTEAAFILILQEPYSEWACSNCINQTKVPFVKLKP